MSAQAPDATELFEGFEGEIDSWASFQLQVNDLTARYPEESFVWRGQSDATWGLVSSLYRQLTKLQDGPPTERQMVAAEQRLLELARTEWRLDGIPALQLFAQMQHVGIPTRLLDVTFNPLIAGWFAVARDGKTDDHPARLLVFTTRKSLQLNSEWNGNTPRWHRLVDDDHRRSKNWGTGLGRKIWRPPALHDRIPAQNAAFILDGVPLESLEAGRRARSGRSTWTPAELRHWASVPMRLAHVEAGRVPQKSPVFTFRITPRAKAEIRDQLEKRFGYSFATLYPDIEGLADFSRRWPGKALTPQ